jgi:hypothetical protein
MMVHSTIEALKKSCYLKINIPVISQNCLTMPFERYMGVALQAGAEGKKFLPIYSLHNSDLNRLHPDGIPLLAGNKCAIMALCAASAHSPFSSPIYRSLASACVIA